MTTYKIQDSEAGNVIDFGLSLTEAQEVLAGYEQEDKLNNNYTERFYEIVEEDKE